MLCYFLVVLDLSSGDMISWHGKAVLCHLKWQILLKRGASFWAGWNRQKVAKLRFIRCGFPWPPSPMVFHCDTHGIRTEDSCVVSLYAPLQHSAYWIELLNKLFIAIQFYFESFCCLNKRTLTEPVPSEYCPWFAYSVWLVFVTVKGLWVAFSNCDEVHQWTINVGRIS